MDNISVRILLVTSILLLHLACDTHSLIRGRYGDERHKVQRHEDTATQDQQHKNPTHDKPTAGPTSGDSIATSCSDYNSCQLNLDLLRKALKSRSLEKACSHVTASFQCQRTVTQMCDREGLVDPGTLMKMRRAYIYSEIYMQEMCYSGTQLGNTITKGGSHCSEFRSCFWEVKTFTAAFKNKLYHEACGLASRIYHCSKAAIEDCRRRGNTTLEALELMEDTSFQAGVRVETVCAYTTTTRPTVPTPKSIFSCFEYADCPKPDLDVIQFAKRTGRYTEACRTMKPYARCSEMAMADCMERNLITGVALQSMQQVVFQTKKDVETFCTFHGKTAIKGENMALGAPAFQAVPPNSSPSANISSTHSPVRCLDIGSCPRPVEASPRSIQDFVEACKNMTLHSSCIEYATNDCRNQSLITGSAFDAMELAVSNARLLAENYCHQATTKSPERDDQINGGDDLQLECTGVIVWCLAMILVLYQR